MVETVFTPLKRWPLEPSMLKRVAVRRIVCAVVAAELARLREINLPQAGLNDCTEATAIGDNGLGLDSLERLGALGVLADTFGIEESLFDSRPPQTVADWIDLVMLALDSKPGRITVQTSGSTGKPRPCVHCVTDLLNEATFLGQRFFDRRRVLALVPAHHLYGMIWTALLPAELDIPAVVRTLGAPLGLTPGDLVVAVPEQWRAILRLNRQIPEDVVGVNSAGSLDNALGINLLSAGLARMVDVYGASETGAIAMRDLPATAYDLLPRWRMVGVDDQDVQLVDHSGCTVPLPDHIERISDHKLRLAGRRDGAVQVAGCNVWPERVAEVLRSCEGVSEATVRLGIPGRLKAYIVPVQGYDTVHLQAAIERAVAAQLTDVEHPKSFRFGATLPRNTMGKLLDWT